MQGGVASLVGHLPLGDVYAPLTPKLVPIMRDQNKIKRRRRGLCPLRVRWRSGLSTEMSERGSREGEGSAARVHMKPDEVVTAAAAANKLPATGQSKFCCLRCHSTDTSTTTARRPPPHRRRDYLAALLVCPLLLTALDSSAPLAPLFPLIALFSLRLRLSPSPVAV